MSYCDWDNTSELNTRYHDEEWGIPVFDDRKQFEYLMMEVMQCGLNWNMMINKREIFRKCFNNFEYDLIAKYNENDIDRIMNTEGMIKSKRKIEAIINNAKCFLQIRKEYGSFCNYLWAYSNNKTILYDKHELGYIPVSNGLSDKITKDLKSRGFKYLGTITIYSHLQAAGIINDHDKNCKRYEYINSNYPTVKKKRYLEKNVSYFGNK
ncbi:DNA-3-methyladenine glycosylase I [bacterium]|nr:DNA-3-methyladenine glycosylase I [bacterium]